MKFSIIIPCYKVEQYLHQCVDSVLAQTYEDYEVILVDDGSPDNSPAICDEYGKKTDKVKVIHKPNGGLSDARNTGLDMARGEFVLFLDSDDWWDDKEALRKIDTCIKKTGADIIIFGMKKYFSLEKRYGDVRIPKRCDKVVRRTLIEKDNQRFVKRQLSEDIEWCCKLLLKDSQIDVLEEAFYVYRQQVSTSITANVGTKNINSILDVINRYAKKNAPEPLLHYIANQYVLLITNFMRLGKEDQKPLEAEVKNYWWLINYNWYPYTRMVSKVKFLGYNITKKLLRIYYKQKRNKR